MNCPRCDTANDAGRRMCGSCGTDLPNNGATMEAPPPIAHYVLRRSTFITRCLQALLIIYISQHAVAVALRLYEQMLLRQAKLGAITADVAADATAADARLNLVLYAGVAIFFITAVVFLAWIYRMNANLHALGVRDLQHTPGWSVGCFFVPFVNLWVPYLVLRELLSAGQDPVDGQRQVGSGAIAGWWWGAYVGSGIAAYASSLLMRAAHDIDDFIFVSEFAAGVAGLRIVSAVISLWVVARVYARQSRGSDTSLASVFA